MGIPQLTSLLQPYSSHQTFETIQSTSLKKRLAVIDGPSLAYFVYRRLARSRLKQDVKNAFEAVPDYRMLQAEAVRVLETFEVIGFEIKAVYFDGALPPAKVVTRISRLESISARLNKFFAANSANLPPAPADCGYNRNELGDLSQPPTAGFNHTANTTRDGLNILPEPPFLVPAIAEGLFHSRFRNRTVVVPGEADPYCAALVRNLSKGLAEGAHPKSPGEVYVFTSDSDLLIHDLNERGRVLFLTSLDLPQISATCMQALVSHPQDIAKRLGLSRLLELGFVLSQRGNEPQYARIEAARELQKNNFINDAQRNAFDEFVKEYTDDPAVRKFVLAIGNQNAECGSFPAGQLNFTSKVRQMLDSRVSEFVQQISALVDSCPATADQKLHTITIYLPPLVDDPTRAAAWRISQPTRELAYSVFASLVRTPIHVHEVCRRGGGSSVAKFGAGILSRSNIKKRLLNLSQDTDLLLSSSLTGFWLYRALALLDLLRYFRDNGQAPPNGHALCLAAVRPPPGPGGWDGVHLCAQVSGAMYSLRMLKQICDLFQTLIQNETDSDKDDVHGWIASWLEKCGDCSLLGDVMPGWGAGNQDIAGAKEMIEVLEKLLHRKLDWTELGRNQGRAKKNKRRKKNQAKNEELASQAVPTISSNNQFAALQHGE